MFKVMTKESEYQHFIQCNFPHHQQLAANTWEIACSKRFGANLLQTLGVCLLQTLGVFFLQTLVKCLEDACCKRLENNCCKRYENACCKRLEMPYLQDSLMRRA